MKSIFFYVLVPLDDHRLLGVLSLADFIFLTTTLSYLPKLSLFCGRYFGVDFILIEKTLFLIPARGHELSIMMAVSWTIDNCEEKLTHNKH